MKRLYALLCGLTVGMGFCVAQAAVLETLDKPNVLVILVDDLGYGDLSCQGSTEIITPNIDALAASGIRFTDGYVTAPQCGPSRAGLISGVFQDRFGCRLQVNPDRMLVFSLKSAGGKALTHTCEKTGALPLNQWHFIALRYSDKDKISITVLNEADTRKGAAIIAERSEVLEASDQLIFTQVMLPRIGSNADASGSFLQG